MDWKFLLPLAITGFSPILDGLIDGARLTSVQVKTMQSLYSAALIWGDEAVASTETDFDDQALATFKRLCEDTAKEGGHPLPVLAIIE